MSFWIWIALGLLALATAGALLHLRTLASRENPVFVIEERIEIDAPADEVWRILADTEAYPDWNPYVLRIEGRLEAGSKIALTITQENWKKPLTLHPVIVTAEGPRKLGWHGSPLVTGFLETDHYFELEPLGPDRTRLHHVEEFRGWLATRLNQADYQRHTGNAFRAMNEALAKRAEGMPRESSTTPR